MDRKAMFTLDRSHGNRFSIKDVKSWTQILSSNYLTASLVMILTTILYVSLYNTIPSTSMTLYLPNLPPPMKFSFENLDNSSVNILKERESAISTFAKFGFRGYKQFFDYVTSPVPNLCKNETEFGGKWYAIKQNWNRQKTVSNKRRSGYRDGNKIVCLDQKFFGDPKNCVVISIGISNDWTFDDASAKFGCQVYSFDHTIPKSKLIRKRRIHFYPYGVGPIDTMTRKGRIMTLSSMVELIKQQSKSRDIIVNYLKMDVEGAELEVLQSVLKNPSQSVLNKVRQIGMEIHPGKINTFKSIVYKRYFECFMALENLGFVLFSSLMNPVPNNKYFSDQLHKYINGYYELVWVKL